MQTPPNLYHLSFELYNLAIDPWEQENLAYQSKYKDIRDQLTRRLRQWVYDTEDPVINGPITQATYRNHMDAFQNL